jgi:hypothetical protein
VGGEIFMRKLVVLLIVGIFFYEGASAKELTFKGYQDLKHYKARSGDEEKIVKLALNYQKAYNLYDHKGVLAVYLPGAIIKAGMKEDRSEHLVTKEEFFDILSEKLTTWKLYNFQLKLFTPKKINIQGGNAKLSAPFIIYSIAQDYWERGIFKFDFRKTDSGWFISRNMWKIVDLFYNP